MAVFVLDSKTQTVKKIYEGGYTPGMKGEITGETYRYNRFYREMASTVISMFIKTGTGAITLKALYVACQATTPDQQNGVQFAVRDAKDDGILLKTKEKGVYLVA